MDISLLKGLVSGPLSWAHINETTEEILHPANSEFQGILSVPGVTLLLQTTVALHNYSSKMFIAAANELTVFN